MKIELRSGEGVFRVEPESFSKCFWHACAFTPGWGQADYGSKMRNGEKVLANLMLGEDCRCARIIVLRCE